VTRVQNWPYNEETDTYICCNGKTLRFKHENTKTSKNGYSSLIRVYECDDCKDCPYRKRCITKTDKADFNKQITINRRGNELKAKARSNLTTEQGLQMRSLRSIEVESVFGDIKANSGTRRFMLKGLNKVKLEWGLLCIAHNMRKMVTATA